MKRNNYGGIVFGLLLLVAGGGYLAEALGLIRGFTIFFDGWWTLFIIVPCFCGLLGRNGGKIGHLIGVAIGLFLLLEAQNVLDHHKVWALALAVVCILFGLNLIFPKKTGQAGQERGRADRSSRAEQATKGNATYTVRDGIVQEEGPESTADPSGSSYQEQDTGEKIMCSAVFAGRDIRVDHTGFYGAELSALFGGIDLNLKTAVIRKNVMIEAKAAFGGIDLIMPPNVRVAVEVTPVFGSVKNGTWAPSGADGNTPTVFIKGTCLFGGIEIQ